MTAEDERTALRLLGSASKNSYDPDLDIDWDAPLDHTKPFMPFERISIYGTPMWDGLSDEQKIELSKHELASIASTGLWFEIVLMQMLARHAYHRDPRSAKTQYSLTEIGDETRHAIMFAKMVDRLGCPRYQPNAFVRMLARPYAATARGPLMFAPVLVAEETTDRLQRSGMNDEAMNPLPRMVSRIHVLEEARHVRFAREEVQHLVPRMSRPAVAYHQLITALVSAAVISVFVDPAVYASVGLDPREAARVARHNPHHRETVRWMGEKVMAFLEESGMVSRFTRPIYRRVNLL